MSQGQAHKASKIEREQKVGALLREKRGSREGFTRFFSSAPGFMAEGAAAFRLVDSLMTW